jgi:hypothetical protein
MGEYNDFERDDSDSEQFQIHELEFAKIVSNGTFLNAHTGAACVLTHCKHFSHLSCLKNYLNQEQSEEARHQREICGFS